jgi:hypothetical protein
MTPGDLVRNEVFSRVADSHPDEVESLDQQYWQPFYEKFKSSENSLFDDYFFPFGLIKNPNLKKSGVYAYLRQQWKEEKQPKTIIEDLASFQDAFLDLAMGTNRQEHTKDIATAIQRMSAITPSSTYPFLMQLSNALKTGAVSPQNGIEVLSVVESFLIRRALCGHEPTGLHAVFKKLWEDCGGSPNAQNVEKSIRTHKTVVWPSADEVKACVQNRALYGSSIGNFVVTEWNRSLGGDLPNIKPWIEHVLPDGSLENWKSDFTEEQHKKSKDLFANLLPLTPPMNQSLSDAAYAIKRPVYLEDSIFKGAREFAKEFENWTPETLAKRSAALADWVVGRWTW